MRSSKITLAPTPSSPYGRSREYSGEGEKQMARDSNSLLARLGQRAISDQDSEQEKLNKTLLIFASALMAFAAMVWVAIYHAMGIRFSTTVPFTYVVLSAASLALYLWKGNL